MPKSRHYLQVFQKNSKRRIFLKILKFFLFSFFSIFFFFLFLISFVFILYAKDLPRPEKFTERQLAESTKIFDRTGNILLYEIYQEEKRTWVPLEQIPENLKQAIIATEDANFYHHFGVDLKGIFRAALADLKILKPVYGASTIPQQLIRSTFLSLEKTPKRKTREVILALELDRRYSKDQILEWYLNQIPFGRNAYGVEAASQAYFKKPVSEISLVEAATLAALIKAPSYYSAEENFQELTIRKNYVLDRMVSEGFLDPKQAQEAKEEEIKIAKLALPILAPHFTLWVKEQLEEKYGRDFLERKGLKIYTTLDWELQEIAEKVVKERAEKNKAFRAYNASLVAIDPKTGQILALVGSKDFFGEPYPKDCQAGRNCLFDPQFNVAIGNPGRQPGSAFKPFVYATAFKKGYSDKTIVEDSPTCWPQGGGKFWCPQNYDQTFRGPVTLREGLAQSLNVPSVKVLDSLAGLEDSIKTAQEMGITTLTEPSKYGLSIVLGGAEVKLLDMVSAYGVFATGGLKNPPISILKIEDAQGRILIENKNSPKRVLGEEIANLITDILSDNEARAPIFGYHSPMYFENFKVAAKTGTTQNYRDGWIVGYSSSLVAGVWAGNNDNSPMSKAPGIVVAGPIWRAFMEKALLKYNF